MNLRTAARGFVAFLLSVPALQGNPYWAVTYPSSNICALSGSTVDIICNYKYPKGHAVEKKLWFTNINHEPFDLKDDTDYGGRVEYICGEPKCWSYSCTGTCTLRIKDVTQRDSAYYKFRITTNQVGGAYSGYPGVKLSVTDFQVEVVIHSRYHDRVQLKCHSMCDFPGLTYTWYRNGNQQHHGMYYIVYYITSEYRVSCAVKGSAHLHSPSVYAPETPSVGWTPPGVIEEGSSVNLTCSSEANPVAKYTWTKVTTDHSLGHSVQGQQLSFHPIQSSDSGQYLCKAKNDLGTKSSPISIDVKYGPKHTSVIPSPPGEIMEGGSVTLSCSSDANPAADYTWFKDNQPLPWEPRRPYTLDPVSSKDRGTYHCQAENQYGYLGSNSVFIDVLYAPKTPSVSVRPPGEIKEGGSVTLSCSSDANPAADYTWFREHGGSVEELGENYTISNITTELGGNYYCEAPLTNRSASAAQREPIEEQDDPHYASIHISRSKNQEVPHGFAGALVESDHTEQVLYSAINLKRPKAVPE
ncbi:unnamed protein product [Gadus morhua 'NCC']